MGHFRAEIQGARGVASRLGTKKSGLDVSIASWEGSVSVRLWYDERTGVDMAAVALTPHYGQGTSRTLYRGPVSGIEVKEEESQGAQSDDCGICGESTTDVRAHIKKNHPKEESQ